MLNYLKGHTSHHASTQAGFTLLEILITLALLAFGLTALVNLQMKLHMTEVESYQRGQAIILVQDMADRLQADGYLTPTGTSGNGQPIADSTLTTAYVHPYITDEDADGDATDDPLGKGDADYDPGTQSCSDAFTVATHPNSYRIDQIKCEWSEKLKGASEILDPDGTPNSGDEVQIGGMIDARGCVEQTQAPNFATCTPANYRVTVVWQGMHDTAAPNLNCAQNLYGGADGEPARRAISTIITISMPGCQL